MSEPDLSIFVEFGVGLAGFSGVVVAFTRGTGHLGEYDRFRVVQLLLSSLVPAFLGVLPVVLAGFGIHGEAAARAASATLALAIVATIGTAIVQAHGMSERARSNLSPTVWRVSIVSSVVFFAWNVANFLGRPSPPSFGPVTAGMAWYLALASLMFFRLLLVRLRDDD